MQLAGAHLTYCTNIHPGESLAEVKAALEQHVVEVKRAVCPDRPFGVGLRLSAAAAAELLLPGALQAFRARLDALGLYVFTLNGFPFGAFHGTRVKESVYRPDWLEDARGLYAGNLARVLAGLLPSGMSGSISTVPGCFRARGTLASAGPELGRRFALHAAELWRLEQQTGVRLSVALEPEPACAIETTAEAVEFFGAHVFRGAGLETFTAHSGLDRAAAERGLRRHLGLCLDACHAAVEFEDARETVQRLGAAGIEIFKLQVSAGLRVTGAREALSAFDDGVYLHQVVAKQGAELKRFDDLSVAFAAGAAGEWRVHFHVPVFREELGAFQSTQSFVRELLALQRERPFTAHLEVETYTFDVLPPEHRDSSVTACIARELEWTREQL